MAAMKKWAFNLEAILPTFHAYGEFLRKFSRASGNVPE
jgi:hypothetical protein